MAVLLQSKVLECGFQLWPRLKAGPVCDTQRHKVAYVACGAIQVLSLLTCFTEAHIWTISPGSRSKVQWLWACERKLQPKLWCRSWVPHIHYNSIQCAHYHL